MLMFINVEQKICFHVVSLWLWVADVFPFRIKQFKTKNLKVETWLLVHSVE